MLKGNISNVLTQQQIKVDMEVADMLTGSSYDADILVVSREVLKSMRNTDKFMSIVTIDNFMSEEEIQEKLIPEIEKLE